MKIMLILFAPFAVPLVLLLVMSAFRDYLKLEKMTLFKKRFSFILIWVLLGIFGFLLRDRLNTWLTLIIPNICFFLAFFDPIQRSDKSDIGDSLLDGVFACGATLFFWHFTISSKNWAESSMIFIFILPCLIVMSLVSSVIVIVKSRVKKKAFYTIFCLVSLLFLVGLGLDLKNETEARAENKSKTQLFDIMRKWILKHPTRKVSNNTLIEETTISDVYETKANEITNKYGGKVIIEDKNDNVSVTYTMIPNGEACFNMYYINNPVFKGFPKTYINEKLLVKAKASVKEIEEQKRNLCFGEPKLNTIQFSGSKKEIIKNAKRLTF